MADEPKAVITPVNDTQEAPMPSAEQKIAQPVTEEKAAPIDSGVTEPLKTDEELPEAVSERTRAQFDKLRDQLRSEREKRIQTESAFQSMQLPPRQEIAPTPIYDPNTGLLNEQVFTDVQRQATEAKNRAERAEQAVKNYLNDQEARVTFEAYPELDPKAKTFDKGFHVDTRRIILDSMINPQDYGNKQLSFKEAADLVKKGTSKVVDKAVNIAKEEGAKQAMEQLTPKEQASLEAVGTPAARNDAGITYEQVRDQTRKGNLNAVMSRMASLKKQG